MAKKFWYFPLIACLALPIYSVLGADTSFERHFCDRIKSEPEFSLGDMLPSDMYCVLPGGEFPHPFVRARFDGYAYQQARAGDSQDNWFVLLVSEYNKTVEVLPIAYRQANLKNTTSICSARLRIYASPDKSVLAVER
ncbi:hypothetical protein GIW81_03075 [Hyphomicrobium sp. xq]|uniref:Secreted protein n=1 Tax=Hyphomicrobium album TaxID=2665159 RepID=A0A6I3KD08_9HYPH|nr:hypothetical protein [Hyphomicrobium album]MTD93315.1 hypothetical protein [Hyphomicrobium album]